MPLDPGLVLAGVAVLLAVGLLLLVWRQAAALQRLRLLGEQALAGQRGEAETLRASLATTERALTAVAAGSGTQLRTELGGMLGDIRTSLDTGLREQRDGIEARLVEVAKAAAAADGQLRVELGTSITDMRTGVDTRLRELREGNEAKLGEMATAAAAADGQLRVELTNSIADMRTGLDTRLKELREGNEAKLGEIQKTVNEQLHEAVEKQMTASFARVIEQFAAVQKAMGDVQAVTAQIGDIKRLFGNVRTRGGWGETQLRALLDDILPVGAYVTNYRPRPNSAEVVEFAVIMPMRGETKVHLPIDAKFPVEDYERMLAASESGDAEAARLARRGLERRIRDEARKISEKYIFPPATVEFAVLYLPTDGLYIEVAQIPGLIDEIGRMHRVILLGPSLFPALLRTIHLGHVTLALEQNTAMIGQLLGATRTEMAKIDVVLERLGKQAGGFSTTIEQARTRTRAVDRKLRSVEAIEAEVAEQLIGVVAEQEEDI